jgi:hypothetical protein
MRYSRMLEESSFANRKADYFWLLLLSSVMLLVESCTYDSPLHELIRCLGIVSTLQSAIPIVPPRVCSNLYMVTQTSLDTNIFVRTHHDNRTIPTCCSCCVLVGIEWDLEGCYRRSSRLCSWTRGLVHERCLDSRDGRR